MSLLTLFLIAVEDVYINGGGPYRFLIDTGAQSTVVAPRVARQLGLSPSYRVEVVTVNGRLWAPGRKVTSVSVGRHSAAECEVLWYEPPVTGFDGILGQSFLKFFPYSIDYRTGAVQIGGQAPASGVRVPVRHVSGRPAIEVGGLLLGLDSGASGLVLFKPVAGWRAGVGTVEAQTAAGRSALVRGWFDGLHEAALAPAPASGLDGLLPASWFDAVFVDPMEGYAVLEARQAVREGADEGGIGLDSMLVFESRPVM